jgi:hypothetical protein
MADPLVLNSKTFKRPVTMPEPQAIIPPKRGDYLGAEKDSDAATLAGPMGSPIAPFPGSAPPGTPWRSVSPEPRKRGALRG